MWAHTFSPHMINEFRASAQQLDFQFAPTAATAASPSATLPTITLASTMDFFWGGFAQSTFPQGRGHKTFQFQDAVSYNVGTHTMKIGADLAVLLVQDHVPFNSFGLLNISAGGNCPTLANAAAKCTDLQNYLDNFGGPAGTFSKSFGNPLQNVGTNQQAYYFQDSWKVKSNLTLDYGVRYEYQPFDALNSLQYPSIDRATFATDPLLLRKEVKNDRNNFAPRFGFAYSPKFLKSIFGDNKTVLRGGYGMFYDAFFTNLSNNVAASSPNAIGFSRTASQSGAVAGGRGFSNPLGQIAAASAVASPTATITSVDSNFKNPLIHQWNLNVQRELPMRLKAEVAYVGTRGERLWASEQLNPFDPNLGTREVASRGSVVVRGNRADSIYHGLQAEVNRSMGYLQIRGSYTYSKAIDNSSEVFVTSGGASRWQNVKDPRSDRAVSAFDRTHRAAISYYLTAPSPWKHGLLGALTSGWQTSGVISFQSGTPETIYFGGVDQNGDGEAFNDRPTLGNPNATTVLGYTLDGTNFFDWNTDAPASRDSFKYLYIDGQNGNVSRNSFRYPGTMGFDASVLKDFNMPYREGHKVQLRMDMINAFNHPNLGVSGLDGDVTNSDTFLNINNTRRGGRSLVLWAKYIF
jgi:hypothetical protein